MADTEIIKVKADISELQKQLDEIDKRFGATTRSAQKFGSESEKSSRQSSKNIGDVTSKLSQQEREYERLTKTIKEQERITSEFRQEMIRLQRAYQEAGKDGTMAGMRVKKQMDSLDLSIKDQVESVRTLKREQKHIGDSVKDIRKQRNEIKENTKETDKFGSAMKGLAARVGAAFAVERIIAFGKEAVLAADRARGIETAFNRVGLSITNLRKATRGTVSDVELMRATVNASNLGVPIEEMADLLGFAAARARESGDSIDGMVNSIVTGLGRKSTRVLDNLGISAVDLREALGDVSIEQATVEELTVALNKVISEQNSTLDGNVSQISRLSASFDNLLVTIGKGISPLTDTLAEDTADFVDDINSVTSNENISGWKTFAAILASIAPVAGNNPLRVLALESEAMQKALEPLNKEMAKFEKSLNALNEELYGETTQGIIEALKEQIENYDELIVAAQSESEIYKINAQRISAINDLKRIQTNLSDQEALAQAKINAKLREQQHLREFQAGAENEDEPNFEFLSDFEGLLNSVEREERESYERREKMADEYYDAALEAKLESDEQMAESNKMRAQLELEQEQQLRSAMVMTAANMFQAIATLAGDNAEISKAIAIFEATLSAYKAIASVYGDNTVPVPAKLPLAVSIGALAFAQVAKISQQEVPKFYEGTDFVPLNGNKKGKDTVSAMLHEGEAVIPSDQNRKYPGLAKSWIKGDLDKYISAKHVKPVLEKHREQSQKEKAALMAQAIHGSINARLDDTRMYRELKRSRLINQEVAMLLKSNKTRNPYRAGR